MMRKAGRKFHNPANDMDRCPVCLLPLKYARATQVRICDRTGSGRRLFCGTRACRQHGPAAGVYEGPRLASFEDRQALAGWCAWADRHGVGADLVLAAAGDRLRVGREAG